MPELLKRKLEEVPPPPAHFSAKTEEQKALFERFIREVGSDVGELQLAQGENSRGIKARLSRAATRVGVKLQIWADEGKVYFRQFTPKERHRRPRDQGAA